MSPKGDVGPCTGPGLNADLPGVQGEEEDLHSMPVGAQRLFR